MSHHCPNFLAKVVGKYEKGVVVVDTETEDFPPELREYHNLWIGGLGPRGRMDLCREAFNALEVGTTVMVTCQDHNHPHSEHIGPDGRKRPNVSAWKAHTADSANEAETHIAAAQAWNKAGGGKAIVYRVYDSFLLCKVSYRHKTFVGLWHQSRMGGDTSFLQLADGTETPRLRLAEEPTNQGVRANIRFELAT
jgi:hypothetical protein